MDGVAVYGVDVALLVVVEDAVSNEGTGTNDVLNLLVYTNVIEENPAYPVRHDVAFLSVHDESCRLRGNGWVCVERACLAEVDRNDAFHNALNRLLPLSRVVHCTSDGHDGNVLEADVTARVVDVHLWCGRRSYAVATVGIRLGFDLLHWALVAGGRRLLALAVRAILFHGWGCV